MSDEKQQKIRVKLPRDINKAMVEMMRIIEELKIFLIAETDALKEADTRKFMALQDDKLDIAGHYLDGMHQLLARKEEIKKGKPALKQRLEIMRQEFAEIAYNNHAALNRMKNGMKRLGERIMETARETAAKERQFIYGANGHMQRPTGSGGTIGFGETA